MADLKISELSLISSLNVAMYIPIVDPNEAAASDRNKRFTISQLLGAFTSFTGTTQALSTIPQLYAFKGTSTCTATLPVGSDGIIGLPLVVVNLGTAELFIDGNGSDVMNMSDPFSIPAGDKKMYILKWLGSTDGWVINN